MCRENLKLYIFVPLPDPECARQSARGNADDEIQRGHITGTGNHSSASKGRTEIDELYTYQANVSRLKASDFSFGIPPTDPSIELDQISTTSSSGRKSREKDVISIA